MRSFGLAIALLGALLMPPTAARCEEERPAAGLRARAARIEGDMARILASIKQDGAALKTLRVQEVARPADGDLGERIDALQQAITRNQAVLALDGKEVARLRAEADRLDASKAPDPPAQGLWGPRVEHEPVPEADKLWGKYNGAELVTRAGAVVRTQALIDASRRHKLLLPDVRAERVLVVEGAFDEIGAVLRALRIPHHVREPRDLRGLDLGAYRIILWGCGERTPPWDLKHQAAKLEAWIRRGGFLYTTDWGVKNVLGPLFPGRLASGGPQTHMKELITPIEVVPAGAGSLYLRGVTARKSVAKWWLEEAAFDVLPGAQFRGVRLLESRMIRESLHREGTLALVFAHGRGRVMHVVAHAYQQAGNVAGAIAAQRLLLNFLLMSQLDPAERPADGLPAPR